MAGFVVTLFWQIFPWGLTAVMAAVLGLRLRRDGKIEAERARALQAQQHLSDTLTRIQQAVESASDAIGIGDMDGTSLYHNRAHIALFGYSVMELNATEGGGILFADAIVARAIHAAIRAGYSWSGETDVRTKDGRLIPCHVRADIIRDAQGRGVGIFGVFTDVSERLRNQRLLDEQRQRLEITLQSIGDAVITTDVEGRVVLMNPVAQQLTGMSQSEAAGRSISDVLRLRDERTRLPCENEVLTLLRDPQPGRFTHLYVLGDDPASERILAENATLIRTSSGVVSGAVLALRDVTRERKRAEEAARATKLESLGLMAGSIAHDFGNLLTSMVAQLSLAQMEPNLSERLRSRLDETERAIWRARNVTQQLTLFARGGVAQKTLVSLDPLLREAVGFATSGCPVRVEYAIAPGLWGVDADEGQLVQVVNNLAINAVQAMPRGGTLTVIAVNEEGGAGSRSTTREGRWVRITVSDTGIGIAPEHLPKIFEPFFTTKPRGTGLGLATSYAILKKHGGQLSVQSTLGSGTTFCILLPAASDETSENNSVSASEPGPSAVGSPVTPLVAAELAPAVPVSKSEPRPAPARARLRVLLVDDDPGVREGIAVMLTLLNCEAESATNSADAVKKFQAARVDGAPFGAALIDLRLGPADHGTGLVRVLRAIDPALKAVLISGDRDDPAMIDPAAAGFDAAFPKPFKMAAVDAQLRQLLTLSSASGADTSVART